MFSKIIMSICALLAGCGVSAGVFAFVLVIGVIPRDDQALQNKQHNPCRKCNDLWCHLGKFIIHNGGKLWLWF